MIGLVLVTHGRLAVELVNALQHVVGAQEDVECVCIDPDDDLDVRRAEILAAVDKVDSGRGVILLTDMFGGTPSNLAMSTLGRGSIDVVAGVNLPMLVKLASVRANTDVASAVTVAEEAGRKYIRVASRLISARG